MDKVKIRVAMVDDHPVVLEGLRAFLQLADDILIVGEAHSGQEAIELATSTNVDVVIMDLVMPGHIDGIEAIRQIRLMRPAIQLLALTSFQQDESALAAISAGAIGYLHKDVSPDLLLGGIRQAATGRMVMEANVWAAANDPKKQLSGGAARNEDAETKRDSPMNGLRMLTEPLTERELEVLREMATGLSNKEIGLQLGITEKTVKVHVSHILAKCNVFDRTQAVVFAIKTGMVEL